MSSSDYSWMNPQESLIRQGNYQSFKQPQNSQSACFLIKKIPIEIFHMILELLLVNPALGEYPTVSQAHGNGLVHLDLSPKFLMTCQVFYRMGYTALYEWNTFVVAFSSDGDANDIKNLDENPMLTNHDDVFSEEQLNIYCPLMRRCNRYECRRSVRCTRGHITYLLQRVTRWKVILIGSINNELAFYRWVLAVCKVKIQSLELLVVPSGFPQPSVVLTTSFPLVLLENVQKVTFIPLNMPENTSAVMRLLNEFITNQNPMGALATLYRNMLAYAQAFERGMSYKHCIMNTIERVRRFQLLIFSHKPTPGTSKRLSIHRNVCMLNAERAVRLGDLYQLRIYQSALVQSLEDTYRGIFNAAEEIHAFIDVNKKAGRMFSQEQRSNDPKWQPLRLNVAERERNVMTGRHAAVYLLKEYCKALRTRKLPSLVELKVEVGRRQKRLDRYYSNSIPELAIARLEMFSDEGDHPNVFQGFFELFRGAVDDLDKQFLEMNRARRVMHAWNDDNVPGGLPDPLGQSWDLVDEMVDWDVNTPPSPPSSSSGEIEWVGQD